MEIFGRFTLNEYGIWTHFQNGSHRPHIRLHDVLQGCDKTAIIPELFIPPAVSGGKRGADKHLVDGRVQLYPGETPREVTCIDGKEIREIRMLKVANPIGHA